MYRLVEYKNEFKSRWNAFAKEKGTVFHRIEWKEVLEEVFGYRSHYFMVMDEAGEIMGLLPIIEGRDITMKKAGVSMPFVNHVDICCVDDGVSDFAAEQVHALLGCLKLDYIELRFKDGELRDDTVGLDDSNYTFVIPLDGGEEKVLSLSSGSNRNHVRKTYKNNWFSVSFEEKNLTGFYRVYRNTMKRLGSPAPAREFFEAIMKKLGQEVKLLTVIDNESGGVIGGMFLFLSKDTVFYQWGGCLAEYNKKYVNNFMYWEAVKFSMQKGFRFLDLGRSPFDSGTYKFKQQWGADPVQLKYYRFCRSQKYSKPVKKDDLSALVSVWKAMPGFIADAAGKILIKYVMP